jgi:glutamate-1-semialdehyde 2,1-aminomutase
MGTTLSASPLQLACLNAALAEVMTEANYARMLAGAARLEQGLNDLIQGYALPWHVVRVGARVELVTSPTRLLNGAEAKALPHSELEATLHLGLVNRGCLVAPFHNMMLVSPVTRNAQIDTLVNAMDDMMGALVQKN